MINLRIGIAVPMITVLLSGCAAIPDTTLGHKCGVPDGVGCLSTQEVYDRSIAGDLPGLNRIDNGPVAPQHDRGIELPVIELVGKPLSEEVCSLGLDLDLGDIEIGIVEKAAPGIAVLIEDDRPFLLADGGALPFVDNAFDYVIAIHVVEHADDIAKFLGELSRVARAGYLETPSAVGEHLFACSWVSNRSGGYTIVNGRLVAFSDIFL